MSKNKPKMKEKHKPLREQTRPPSFLIRSFLSHIISGFLAVAILVFLGYCTYWCVLRIQTPKGMVRIGGGTFEMGYPDNPLRVVKVGTFYMDKYVVTKALWDDIYQWAVTNGYDFDNQGFGKGFDHPVHSVNWYDCVKWCNARSEKELPPVYFTDPERTFLYKKGECDIKNDCVRWDADGYRLPTEAEWEKAARGRLERKIYPWGDSIDGSKANYKTVVMLMSPAIGLGPLPLGTTMETRLRQAKTWVTAMASMTWPETSANGLGIGIVSIHPQAPIHGDRRAAQTDCSGAGHGPAHHRLLCSLLLPGHIC